MIAVNQPNINREIVSVEFKHALANICFCCSGPTAGVQLESISITGVSMKGDLSLTLPTSADAPAWSNISEPLTTPLEVTLIQNTNINDNAVQVTATDGYLMMIPQEIPANAQIIVKFTGIDAKTIPLATSKINKWEPGVQYNYTLAEGTYDFEVSVNTTSILYSGYTLDFNITSTYTSNSGTESNLGWNVSVIPTTIIDECFLIYQTLAYLNNDYV